MTQSPTITVTRSRLREGYVDHTVRTQIKTIPIPSSSTPSPHTTAAVIPAADFAPRPNRGDATSTNWMQRRLAALNPDLSPQLQMRLARDKNAVVRAVLAETSTHPNVEEILIHDREHTVRQALCKTDDVRLLRRLAQDRAAHVRATVVRYCEDRALLTELAEDPDDGVSQDARWKLAGGPYPGGPVCRLCWAAPAVIQNGYHAYRCDACSTKP